MPADAEELIDRARGFLQKAVDQWQPANLQRVMDTRKLLERSAADLVKAIELLRDGHSTVSNLQSSVLTLRRDITTMTSLVDACSAFQRGLALHLGVSLPSYDASGQTVGETDVNTVDGILV